MNRSALYWSANACFGLVALVGGAVAGTAGAVHPLYLILLFALCSTPILLIRSLNDRYGLLALFSFAYFVFYGLLDLTHLLFPSQSVEADTGGLISADELVILVGGVVAHLGYHVGCRLVSAGAPGESRIRDWSEQGLVVWGVVLWAVSTWVTWQLRVHVLVDNSIETASRGFNAMSPLQLDAILIAGYMQPMGIVILAYAYCMYRKPYVLLGLLGAIFVEMIFGFVIDSKGQVLIGVILVSITQLLVKGKVPKVWLGVGAAMIVLVFPVLQANRVAMGLRGTVHSDAAQDIGTTIARALAAQESGHYRSETFIERSSMKHSVAMIVDETGNGVPFENGRTIEPLLYTFIPRSVWPDKPDVPTGRLVNQQFHVSDQVETNISPSHLGELYWNFGWPGVLVGMPFIGALLGFIAALFDLQRAVTLTRILVLIATIKLLILGFESVINVQYSVWMRSMLAIGLLHVVFARVRVAGSGGDARDALVPAPTGTALAPAAAAPRFPNLMA